MLCYPLSLTYSPTHTNTHALISVYVSRLSMFRDRDCLSPHLLSSLLKKYYNKYNTGVANNLNCQVHEKYLACANLCFDRLDRIYYFYHNLRCFW